MDMCLVHVKENVRCFIYGFMNPNCYCLNEVARSLPPPPRLINLKHSATAETTKLGYK